MPYLTYNLPIQRTGFRPYGHTNTWSAVQLSGVGDHRGRPRQVFSEPGGRRLGMGQWQSGFSPWFLSGLRGLGDDPNCASGMPYDVSGNPCPPAPSGPPGMLDTGYNVPDVTPAPSGSGCISAISGQPVACPGGTSPGTVTLPPGSSPRVPASPGLFPQTSPQTIYTSMPAGSGYAAPYGPGFGTTQGCPSGYSLNAQGQCTPAAVSSLTSYLPWILGIGAIALVVGIGSR